MEATTVIILQANRKHPDPHTADTGILTATSVTGPVYVRHVTEKVGTTRLTHPVQSAVRTVTVDTGENAAHVKAPVKNIE